MAPTNQQAKASKAKVLSGGKAPKARVQRYLKSADSQLKEGAKSTLLLKGTKCSQAMGQLLKDLRAMQAPNAKMLTKKNQIFAFDNEGQMSLEFLTTKNDCPLFALASKFVGDSTLTLVVDGKRVRANSLFYFAQVITKRDPTT